MRAIETILTSCAGVTVEKTESQHPHAQQKYIYKFLKTGDIKLPADDIFIEITATATKGTIARVVGLEVETYSERYSTLDRYANDPRIVTSDCTLRYEVDGRKQIGRIRINDHYVKVLVGEQKTKYIRNVKKHKKVEVKNPVNKYKQEMQLGDWVIGVAPGNRLSLGRITRWTNHNVWAVPGDNVNDKSKEFKFNSISETFTMPDDEHVKLLTMAVLKGWNGA